MKPAISARPAFMASTRAFLHQNLLMWMSLYVLLRGQRGLTTQRIAQQSPSRVQLAETSVQLAETDVHVPEISVQLAPKRVFIFDRNPQRCSRTEALGIKASPSCSTSWAGAT